MKKINYSILAAIFSALIITIIIFISLDLGSLISGKPAITQASETPDPDAAANIQNTNFRSTSIYENVTDLNSSAEMAPIREAVDNMYANKISSESYSFERIVLDKALVKILDMLWHGGKLYIVLESYNIYIYDSELNFEKTIQYPIEHSKFLARSLAVYNDELYALEASAISIYPVVMVFDLEGNFKRRIECVLPGVDINTDAFERMTESIAVADGKIYLSSTYTFGASAKIHCFDSDGEYITSYGSNFLGKAGALPDSRVGFLRTDMETKYEIDGKVVKSVRNCISEFIVLDNSYLRYVSLPRSPRNPDIYNVVSELRDFNCIDFAYHNGRYYFMQANFKGLSCIEVFDEQMNYLETYELGLDIFNTEEKGKAVTGYF